MALPLPVWQADVEHHLDLTIGRTRDAKAGQHPAAVMGLLAGLSATPLGRYFAAHQRALNVEVTNVIGPPGPLYLFGARVLAILPIVGPVGNVGLVLCAFSYAGQLNLVVTADAHGFPDLDVLMAGMETEGRALLGGDAGIDLSHTDVSTRPSTALVTLDKAGLDTEAGHLPAALISEVSRGLRRVLGL